MSKKEMKNFTHPDKFGNWLGYELVSEDLKESSVETQLRIREDHLSPSGYVHGGVISSFFDYSFGAATVITLAPKDLCSTIELKVNYLKPIYLHDLLTARVKVIFRGRKICVLQGFIYRNEEKDSTAMATATFNIIYAKSESDKQSKKVED